MEYQDNEKYREYLRSGKWRSLANRRMEIDEHRCQMCESCGTRWNPLEVHHLTYKSLYNEEKRIYQDLITLCRSCHKSLHRAMERTTGEDGRRGWKDNPSIPQIHVFNINGVDDEYVIEKREKQ